MHSKTRDKDIEILAPFIQEKKFKTSIKRDKDNKRSIVKREGAKNAGDDRQYLVEVGHKSKIVFIPRCWTRKLFELQ